jgi:signal transduction histidine kinase
MHLWRGRTVVRARRDFVASVSHELRTPLAQIRMFTETLQLGRERDPQERQQWLNIISREARRLGDLVENILLFSHIDADRTKLEKERTDLGELIEEVVEGFVPIAEQRGMRLLADAPSRIFSLVDPRAMRQVIVNLLDNALKYGPRGQVVSIELERIGTVARITVSDQGPGIAPNDRKRLWQPFVRLGKDAGTTAGSGIGLAVVRALVEQHGATITLDDAPEGGARFVLDFAVSDSSAGLPLRATGEFRAPRLTRDGVMVSGQVVAAVKPGGESVDKPEASD